jgi:hypothetical protein
MSTSEVVVCGKDELSCLIAKLFRQTRVCSVDALEAYYRQFDDLCTRSIPEPMRCTEAERWCQALAENRPFNTPWKRALALVTIIGVVRATHVNSPLLYGEIDPHPGTPYVDQLVEALGHVSGGEVGLDQLGPADRTRLLWLLAAVVRLDRADGSCDGEEMCAVGIGACCPNDVAAILRSLEGDLSAAPAWLKRRLTMTSKVAAKPPATTLVLWNRFWCGGNQWTLGGTARLAAAACWCVVTVAALAVAVSGWREIQSFENVTAPLEAPLANQ